MVSICPPGKRLCVLCEHWCIFVSNPGSIKWSAISGDRGQIAKQGHNYGHNSMRIFTCCIYASPVWQVRAGIVRGQVSIKIFCLHKTMFLNIFFGLCPWFEISWKSCVFLPCFHASESFTVWVQSGNEWIQVWRVEALHPSGQFIPVCGMNIHALVLFFLGACPFIYIGVCPMNV